MSTPGAKRKNNVGLIKKRTGKQTPLRTDAFGEKVSLSPAFHFPRRFGQTKKLDHKEIDRTFTVTEAQAEVMREEILDLYLFYMEVKAKQ